MKRLFSLGLPLAAFAGLLGWLQPMPSLPEGHDGLCRLVEAPVETILCTVPLDRYALRLRAIADRVCRAALVFPCSRDYGPARQWAFPFVEVHMVSTRINR